MREGGDFETFRTQDVGDPGHLQRVSGKRPSGSWATVKWLIGKEDAHVEDGRDLLRKLGSKPVQIRGNRFEAKPMAAQTGARRQNIRKAPAARDHNS